MSHIIMNMVTHTLRDRGNRSIKELILFATLYILNNPNFNKLEFTQHEIFTLWGELFNWAIIINNLKICPNDPTRTKWEVYHKCVPDYLREYGSCLSYLFSMFFARVTRIAQSRLTSTTGREVFILAHP